MRNYHIALLGATGLVGQEIIKVLVQRNFPLASIRLLSADHNAGRKLSVGTQEIEVKEASGDSFRGADIAFLSAGSENSRYFSSIAVQSGAIVIDNSAAFRTTPDVPVIVPEVNPEDIKGHKGIIANPDCSVIPLAVALYPLHRVNPIKRIVVATYHS
ncbi:MAG: aspartate-semialdehyde dehydrogenase, partial [Dehalococcoidales bacterium]|nr:aspartate-semialdehyde dehydrogenase [Dehalococcoidales bacterium]